ncbi:MAG: helix-turn-helix domain-containing protein [Deltaproteobacteria bacterium]
MPNNFSDEPETAERERDTIVVEDDSLREGFTQVPNLLLKRADLSHGAKIAYALLLSYAWQQDRCFPGQDKLAADMGVERKAVIRYLQELKNKGVIRVRRRGMGKTNVYFLPRLADVPKMGHQEVPTMGQLEVRSLGHKEYSTKKTQNEKDLSNFEEPTDPILRTERRAWNESSAAPDVDLAALRDLIDARHHVPETTSRHKHRSPGTPEERETLAAFLGDFARELGDAAPLPSTITRVLTLFQTAQLPNERWGDVLYQARSITQERTAQIRTLAAEGEASIRRKNKMPYFLAVLEDLLRRSGEASAADAAPPDISPEA